MIVAGEASGDAHAAALVNALKAAVPDKELSFFGCAGPKMKEAGVEAIVDAEGLAIVGVPEIARALPMFWDVFKKLKKEAAERKPDAIILVDFPDFNLKLAKALKKLGLKVIYYISPQLWAWRKYRVNAVKRNVDLMLTILPFEKKWYAKQGVNHVEFVGNPLAGEVEPKFSNEEFCRIYELDIAKPIISLLPGSRGKEIARNLPVLLRTADLMAEKMPEIQFVICFAGSRNTDRIKADLKAARNGGAGSKANILVTHGETYEALSASDVAAVTSGTATLETGIIGTPLAIVYKSSLFNYLALRPLIKVPHFGLINLIAHERLAKEFIQYDFTPENLSAELFRLLDPQTNAEMRWKLKKAVDTLGEGGASQKAAKAILRELKISV